MGNGQVRDRFKCSNYISNLLQQAISLLLDPVKVYLTLVYGSCINQNELITNYVKQWKFYWNLERVEYALIGVDFVGFFSSNQHKQNEKKQTNNFIS